jgi:hypothetical protein
MADRLTKGAASPDFNPKDFILFYNEQFELASAATKDNTGSKTYREGICFPTVAFPSDHAAVSVDLKPRL